MPMRKTLRSTAVPGPSSVSTSLGCKGRSVKTIARKAGESGSGKTTLARLLLGMLVPHPLVPHLQLTQRIAQLDRLLLGDGAQLVLASQLTDELLCFAPGHLGLGLGLGSARL